MRLFILISLLFASFVLYANDGTQQPEENASAQAKSNNIAVGDVKEKKEVGKETYEQYCVVCHRDGLAGAPRFRSEQDWKPRLAGRKLDDLLASSIKGLNAMPIKGTCIKCSNDELKAAISYMLPRS